MSPIYWVDGAGFSQGALSGGSCPLSAGSTVLGFLRALCQGVHVPYLLGQLVLGFLRALCQGVPKKAFSQEVRMLLFFSRGALSVTL